MSAEPSLHSMHVVEHERPRSRAKRVAYFVPLVFLMIAVIGMTIIGGAARQDMQADAVKQQTKTLAQPSQQSTLPEICVSQSFPAHPADIWTGERTAASEKEFAAHPEILGMRAEGRAGFEFWGDTQSHNFSEALGRAPWLDSQLAQWLTYFSGLDAQLKKEGRQLVIVVAPEKWELYRENLPDWAESLQGKTHLEQFLEHSGRLPVVDVRDSLRVAKQDAPVYSAVNAHWSPYGAYAAWQQTVACAAALSPDSVWSRVQVPKPTGFDIGVAPNEFTPYGNSSTVMDWATPILPVAEPIKSTITGADGVERAGPTDGSVGLLEMPARTASTSGIGRALIIRDSTGEALAPAWAHAFEQTCQIRHNLDYPDKRPDVVTAAENCGADTVLYVFTERYFSQPPPTLPVG